MKGRCQQHTSVLPTEFSDRNPAQRGSRNGRAPSLPPPRPLPSAFSFRQCDFLDTWLRFTPRRWNTGNGQPCSPKLSNCYVSHRASLLMDPPQEFSLNPSSPRVPGPSWRCAGAERGAGDVGLSLVLPSRPSRCSGGSTSDYTAPRKES